MSNVSRKDRLTDLASQLQSSNGQGNTPQPSSTGAQRVSAPDGTIVTLGNPGLKKG